MRSPSGWAEPGQRPEFDEFTIVLRGALVVESEEGQMTGLGPAAAIATVSAVTGERIDHFAEPAR